MDNAYHNFLFVPGYLIVEFFWLKWLKEKVLVDSSGNLISVVVGKMQEKWSVKKLVYFLYGRCLINRKPRGVKAVQRRLRFTVKKKKSHQDECKGTFGKLSYLLRVSIC